MSVKRWMTALLLLFVAVAAGTWAVKEYRRAKVAPPAPAPAAPAEEGRTVTVYYLHTTTRCVSCQKIESFTAAAVTGARFSQPLAEGRLKWVVLNTDEPANAHFVEDYALVTKSVVVSERVGGIEVKWRRLDRVWELLDDPEAFRAYVEGEVAAFVEKAP